MNYFYLKIRDYYLSLIKDEKKKHEYRLGGKYKAQIGDIFVITSNKNNLDFIKMEVVKVEHYKSIDDAIDKYWKDDFGGLFDSKEEIIKEFGKYYSYDDMNTFGIDVFSLKKFERNFKGAKYLLDTNIIIEREGLNNVLKDVALLYKTIEKLQGFKYIHGVTKEEINKYKDEAVKKSILVKLNSYNLLSDSTINDEYFKKIIGINSSKINSINDDKLLYEVYKGNVDYFITSDKGIIEKAKRLRIDELVLTPEDYLNSINALYPKLIEYDVLSIKLSKFKDTDINDEFFKTLIDDYRDFGFLDRFKKKAEVDVYTFRFKNKLEGFLYLKIEDRGEDYSDIQPIFKKCRRLKIGTFKTSYKKLRLGERFLKIIFDYAVKANVDEIYVTMFKNKRKDVDALISLMKLRGFKEWGVKKSTKEIVLVKDMKHYDYTKDPKFNFPLVKDLVLVKKTFLPIKEIYHSRLFPDLHTKNECADLYDFEACQYAIEKVYVCKNYKYDVNPGDVVCIYRMSDYNKKYKSVTTGIGIIQEIIVANDDNALINECKNKSVFSENELKEFYNNRIYRYNVIVKILFLKAFENKVNRNDMNENGILNDNVKPMLGCSIPDEEFCKLLELGGTEM
ncbi:MAG: hypothetical protein IJ186_05405 [Bacilli bacterium]|nr:hypothetical protein [Bacilli bacterium]